MIRGAHSLTIDAKGRLAIPGRYRDELFERCNGRMVVTVNNTREHCLWLYPLDEWEKVEAKLVALPSFDANHQKLKRFLIGHATDVEMDKSGRILIPALLRDFAKMQQGIYIIGQGNKFEIWSETLWNERREQWLLEAPGDTLSPEMEQLSL